MNGRQTQVLATLDVVQFYAKSHIVPTCAMHVQRSTEVGPVSAFKSSSSCDCYFDSLQSTTTCKSCTAAADCTDPNTTCTMYGTTGFCEAK